MNPHDVIVAQSDCLVAEHLAAKLHAYFQNVSVARDLDEIKHIIRRQGAEVVVLDLDLADMHAVRQLTLEFHAVGFVCTHRVPDEEMWRDTLQAGAIDCCANNDVHEIVRATRAAAPFPNPPAGLVENGEIRLTFYYTLESRHASRVQVVLPHASGQRPYPE